MKVKARKVKDGYLIPSISEFQDKEEIELEIRVVQSNSVTDEARFTDDFIAQHWNELILTNMDTTEFYKSAQYYIERASDYLERKTK
ncbi:MAG TPA: hypothetical protein PK800_07580 [Syntrophorhabdaceae bacterium]|nr:hypothetical protein [Syntrophorhabdaceae bacterium]